MGNLKIAVRLLNREISKMPSTTWKGEKRKQATMANASPGVGLGPYSLPGGGPILTLFYSGLML